MNHFLRKGDFWAGSALACLGAYVVHESSQWDYMTVDGPGPGFFPSWYGGLMLVISLFLVLGTMLKQDAARSRPVDWRDVRRVGFCWVALVISIFAMEYVGFYISFGALIWIFTTRLFEQPGKKAAVVAIAGPVIFYLIFSLGLTLDLPVGELFDSYF